MTPGPKRTTRLERLSYEVVDDILELSDDELLAIAQTEGEDPQKTAEGLRALYERTVLAINKTKLATARAAMQSHREQGRRQFGISAEMARKLWDALVSEKGLHTAMTLAARNGKELSEADIQGMVEDLCELGAIKIPESGRRD